MIITVCSIPITKTNSVPSSINALITCNTNPVDGDVFTYHFLIRLQQDGTNESRVSKFLMCVRYYACCLFDVIYIFVYAVILPHRELDLSQEDGL